MLINCTMHDVILMDKDNNVITVIAPSGIVPRCKEQTEHIYDLYVGGLPELVSIPVNRKFFSEVEGLPPREAGTCYIVSALVANAAPEREDLLVPDDTVRDEKGRIIGCRALARVR